MNIAILSYEYPPETGFGGIGTYSYYHARALAKLGHRVHVFAGSTAAGTFDSGHDGVRVTRVKREGWLHRLLQPARMRRWFWFHNRIETAHAMYTVLREALAHEAFDIVEAPECGGDAVAVSMLLDVPLAIRFHSPARLIMHLYDTPQMDRRLTGFVEQIAINRAVVRTACSRFIADEARTRMGVADPIHVIPNGIDVDEFDRNADEDVAERFNIPRDATVVLFANRMEERKGIHVVGEVAPALMRQYPHVHFVLAGRDLFGYVADRVFPAIQQAGMAGRFHVVGGVGLREVRGLLKRCDIFLLPSLWENCPYSCIEAMTAGRPIVASDCGGVPELIDHGQNGLLAKTGAADSFVHACQELLESRDLRQRLGEAARKTVEERLTDIAVAARTTDLYRQTVATSPPVSRAAPSNTLHAVERRRE